MALESYREEGYLAEAMVNYLMTLGWSPPGYRDRAVRRHRARLSHRGREPVAGILRCQETLRFNGEYLRVMTVDEFTEGL